MAPVPIPFVSDYYQHYATYDMMSLSFASYPSTNSLDHDIDIEAIGIAQEERQMKRTYSIDESIGSNYADSSFDLGSKKMRRSCSVSSLPGLPRAQFRDHILTLTQRYLAAEAVEEAAAAVSPAVVEEDGSADDAMKLVHLLIACAEAVACRDKTRASMLLSDLRSRALVFGAAFQRVASCFVQGLTVRLSFLHPVGSAGLILPVHEIEISSEKKDEALCLVYEICPHMKFGHFVANSTILEAFEGESFIHIIDLGMTHGLQDGHQWRSLIESLSGQSSTPPKRIRITGVGQQAEKLRSIGNGLEKYAHANGITLEFSVVESNLENLRPEDIKVEDNEKVIVNSILQLHCVVKESRGALNSVLQTIHELSPKVLVLVEQDSSHNGPFFLGRFMEALHYYSAIFDSLEAMLPRYDTRRAKVEQFYFAEEIRNIVSCEGQGRVERHERMDQWRRRMSRAGFQSTPIRMMGQAKEWLEKNSGCEGYTLVEEKGCLVLGWKSKPIIATSCWKC
ncbi:hypothetical protein MLD38_032692 [Melastoma candidum]|uniref:Uncharacterized protein n=1 Tax=Melastoma candidum TaxID=119954 RepID=A0ACB9M6U7_9MYRT|nr:hypothetical protein MLD38_032692 [Melastoma candidum]